MTAVRTSCPTCGHLHRWSWEEAFCKFGFEDGDGLVMTESVAEALRSHGYVVTTIHWGFHNVIITDISRDGASVIREPTVRGYDDPRRYLPDEVVALLDDEFSDGTIVDLDDE